MPLRGLLQGTREAGLPAMLQKVFLYGGLLWLLFGLGAAPGRRQPEVTGEVQKKAVKCDLCTGIEGGPRCVEACPTGAATRQSAEVLFRKVRRAGL